MVHTFVSIKSLRVTMKVIHGLHTVIAKTIPTTEMTIGWMKKVNILAETAGRETPQVYWLAKTKKVGFIVCSFLFFVFFFFEKHVCFYVCFVFCFFLRKTCVCVFFWKKKKKKKKEEEKSAAPDPVLVTSSRKTKHSPVKGLIKRRQSAPGVSYRKSSQESNRAAGVNANRIISNNPRADSNSNVNSNRQKINLSVSSFCNLSIVPKKKSACDDSAEPELISADCMCIKK